MQFEMQADEFLQLADGLGTGPAPAGWTPIADHPLLILVGVTGVGKSTTVDALAQRWGQVSLLPNRRKLADLLVIPAVQSWNSEPAVPITDRRQRFEYTARYRERFEGGLAHALSRLALQKSAWPGRLIFDGLRGAEEVTFAATALPLAHFVILHAPDSVRVERLLGRRDSFDQIAGPEVASAFRWEDVPASRALFTQQEQAHLGGLVQRGEVDGAELAAKLAIVTAERRNYDPDAAVQALQRLAPARTILVDTTRNTPEEAAAIIDQGIPPQT